MARHAIPTIPTARLRLRAFTPDDAPAFHAAYGDPETMRYWDHERSPTIARTALYLSHWAKPPSDGHMIWAIARADTNCCIGMVNHHNGSARHRRTEIGYILAPEATGHGYAREAVAAVIHHLHTTLAIHRIEAEIDVRNTRSRALVEHLGFICEAPLMRNRARFASGTVDACLYALVSDPLATDSGV